MKVLVMMTAVTECLAAGGEKLWDLGKRVEDNPLTVFIMFGFVVFATLGIEALKHSIEKKTRDNSRRKGIQSIYSELMMVGVVSFALILSAEVGLLEVRLPLGDCDDTSGSATSASTSTSSGSGSSACGIGFDLLMFEYAHLVLFFMGIAYCFFILITFYQRDRMTARIAKLQKISLHKYMRTESKPASLAGIAGFYLHKESLWAKSVLFIRGAVIANNEARIKEICDPRIGVHERWLARHRLEKPPAPLAHPDEAVHRFDMARFTHKAMSETIVDLLHIPPIVWFVVLLAAPGTNLVHKMGPALSTTVIGTAILPPAIGFIMLMRISGLLKKMIERASGHPKIAHVEFADSDGANDSPLQLGSYAAYGQRWAQGGDDPWEHEQSCCCDPHSKWDPQNPPALRFQIHVVVLVTCFHIGQVVMLTGLIVQEAGALVLICWILPLFPLLYFVPRTVLIFALVHGTRNIPKDWLRHALKSEDDPYSAHHVGHHIELTAREENEWIREIEQVEKEEDTQGRWSRPPLLINESDLPPPLPATEGRGRPLPPRRPASQNSVRHPRFSPVSGLSILNTPPTGYHSNRRPSAPVISATRAAGRANSIRPPAPPSRTNFLEELPLVG
eukprot:TRINITY_DN1916_c0_g1_i1.p1 TRINITY_DN1916_c0_g1~~TRINITY_DN1916_c0_g1_i1.p1  ORF type:complete len:643 (+),score=108.18 TRINITY_DN1916_c0_g1_i1:78-1931(+)